MGNILTATGRILTRDPETTPPNNVEPTFDPLYGFPKGRKQRVMIATEDEMIASKIPLKQRDYCAHLLIKYLHCKDDHQPFAMMCNYQRHKYDECLFNDGVLRMKEYERERRLRERQKRKRMKELQTAEMAA